MNQVDNMKRKENGIIFAPNFGDFNTDVNSPTARNIAPWRAGYSIYVKYETKGGIEIVSGEAAHLLLDNLFWWIEKLNKRIALIQRERDFAIKSAMQNEGWTNIRQLDATFFQWSRHQGAFAPIPAEVTHIKSPEYPEVTLCGDPIEEVKLSSSVSKATCVKCVQALEAYK